MSLLQRSSINSSTLVDQREDIISMSAGSMSVSAHKDYGVFVNGPFSVSSPPTSVVFGGFYKFNPLTMSGIPSTMVTPVPTFEITVPVKNATVQNSINGIVLSAVQGVF